MAGTKPLSRSASRLGPENLLAYPDSIFSRLPFWTGLLVLVSWFKCACYLHWKKEGEREKMQATKKLRKKTLPELEPVSNNAVWEENQDFAGQSPKSQQFSKWEKKKKKIHRDDDIPRSFNQSCFFWTLRFYVAGKRCRISWNMFVDKAFFFCLQFCEKREKEGSFFLSLYLNGIFLSYSVSLEVSVSGKINGNDPSYNKNKLHTDTTFSSNMLLFSLTKHTANSEP